jgi:amino acid adenylation domain-containing protein
VHPKTAAYPEVSYPALPLQQGMIFNGLRLPDAGIDVVQCVIAWPDLDVAAYRAAWERAVARHPILRTGFRLAGDTGPVQVVHEDAALDFTVCADALPDFLAADRKRGFSFDTPPLVRVTVLAHDVPVVVVTLHHAVLDGRSLAMLMTELDGDYGDYGDSAGRPDFPARTEYRDFVEWLTARNAPGTRDAERDRVFWTEHLAGVSGATPLPFGRPADATAGAASQVVRFALTDEETVALRRIADSENVTLNTVVLAAWALVLGAHAGADDVVFGVTRSARHGSVPGADSVIGMLLASIPLRVTVDRSLTVGEWLRAVRHAGVAVRDHQLTPLADIQRCAGVSELLSSLVLFERQDLETLLRRQNPHWRERSIELHRRVSYPLTVYAFAEPTLRITLIHDRFSAAEADVLAEQLRTALVRLGHGPQGRVRDVTPLSTSEPVGHEPVAARTMPDLFDEQVRRRPNADAVFDGDRWWSYTELDNRATRIAHALRDKGIVVEEPVAVALPRGAGMIAALLGVLKAGAAYLPIDAGHPAARTAAMLADARVRVIIAAGGDWPVEVLAVDDLPAAAPFPCPATADTLAYLNYTSGSTGTPKGVAVPHRGVVRLVHEPNFATVGPGQTFLHASSTSFDASTFELWGALLTGARVVPVPPGPLDARDLAALVRRHGVSVLWLTAGLFHQLVEHDVTTLSEVDQLLAGGDVLAPGAVRAALAARGGRPMTNGYGPTENTTFTSCHVMRDEGDLGATTPIGRPVQHTTVHVLDDELRPVPVGAVGELHTGGDGLARGYLNQPARTAAKFVPDPFGPPGSRLYRTGDRARRRPDGTLEFVGRVDNQVKVRGHRVEPGETESVLRTHPQVSDVAVVVHGAGDTRGLVAYLTPETLDLASVRAHVAAALPEYLRPVSYQALPRLPLNTNGKIDRAALPAPATASVAAHVPLTTETQRRMAAIWRGLLGVPNSGAIGAADGFFDLGGNSLLAMRLTFRIRDAFGVELPIREIYRATTLADLTETVAATKAPATNGIVRRDRTAYRVPAANTLPAHLSAEHGNWALWRWVELRGTGFGIAPLLDLATPECAAAAERVIACEREFLRHRGVVLDGIKAELATAHAEAKPALRRGSKLICKGRLPELGEDILTRPHAADLPVSAAALAAAHKAYAAAHADATHHVSAGLRAVAGDRKFREAVAWQNPRALHTAVDSLARTETPRHNSQYRQWTALVTNYLQRYTTKNDTIGFFGPVGWARVVDGGHTVEQRPGPDLLAQRTVYLENWAVHEFALTLSTPDTLPWATPRRMPFVGIDGGLLHLPLREPVELTADEAAVLTVVDGVRTARSIAAELSTVDVYGVLAKLRDERRIAWSFEVSPGELVPQRALRAQLARIDDPAVREPALAALSELERGRDAVAAAGGDPDRLTAAMTDLQDVFTRHTGSAAVRRPGQFYAGRTLVHEECRRDLDVTIGSDLLATLMPPLSLLLESARWFTSAGAALFRRALRDTFRARGGQTMPLADFWLWANDIIFRLDARVIGRLTSTLQERWADILLLDPTQRQVTLSADAVRDKVATAFAAPRPGWRGAVQHSPDVMMAAKDAAAIRAGDFQWVLGELHAGVNTMRSALFVSQHPNAVELHTAMAHDLAGPRIVLAATREEGGTPQRLADALVAPTDLRVVSAHDACGPDLVGSILVADLLLSEVDGRLVAHDRTGNHRMDLVELLNEQLMGQLVQQFRPLPTAQHTPRVSIDKLVISRENWRLPTTDLAFAFAADEPARYLRAQEWRHAMGIPRFVFVKSPVEFKPFYVDLASLPSVEHLAHAIRALDREQPGGVLSVGEMLPGPDELWLTDADGANYTAEFRFVAVDRRGLASEGQS